MKILSNKRYDELLLQSCRGMFGAVTDYTLLRENVFLNDENKRLNNIINELKQKLNLAENILYDYLYKDKKITKELYDSFKELKGDGSNE